MRIFSPGLILFGDSVFLSTGASRPSLSCSAILKSRLQIPLLVIAKKGINTYDAIKKLDENILRKKQHPHVIILFGNNDCKLVAVGKAKVPLLEYKNNLKKIIQQLQNNHKSPILCNLQPLNDELAYMSLSSIRKFANRTSPNVWQKSYSDACYEVSTENKIDFIDIRTELEENRNSVIAKDGLHPNDKGHEIIASIIERKVREITDK